LGYEYYHCIRNPDNFIRKYIEYARKLSDAPWDFHEGMALFLLSCITHGLKLYIPSHPYGLRTNMYMIFYGESHKSRKSTAMNRGRFILNRVAPWCELPENFSPGGLEEALAERPGEATALISDEFAFHLEKMMKAQYMTGVRGFLLTMYNQEKWKYKRTSKGSKKEEDVVLIEDAHLGIVGNLTPAICGSLTERDMMDGFLGRFVFINPEKKPPRIPLDEFVEEDIQAREWLIDYMRKVLQFCDNMKAARQANDKFFPVKMTKPALKVIDAFQEKVENYKSVNSSVTTMIQRVTDYCIKTSILIAAGEFDPEIAALLTVRPEHARQAVKLCNKWMRWATTVGEALGRNPFEDKIQRALNAIAAHGIMPRSIVARTLHFTKPELDIIQSTLIDRGLIYLTQAKKKGSHKPTLLWRFHDYVMPGEEDEKDSQDSAATDDSEPASTDLSDPPVPDDE